MNINEAYGYLLKDFAKIGSWALYDIPDREDETIKKTDLGIDKFLPKLKDSNYVKNNLNKNAIILGLNCASRDVNGLDWGNFHDTRRKSNDYKIARQLKETDYMGSYMSDAIKKLPETNSSEVLKLFTYNRNLKILKENAALLQQEYDAIKPQVIIYLGGGPETIVRKMIKNKFLIIEKHVKFVKIYNPGAYVSLEKLKEKQKLLLENRF